MDKKYFTTRIYYLFEDKNIEKPSIEWLNGLFEKCKEIAKVKFDKGIEQLVSIPQDQWSKTYGFRSRPTIIDLVEILTGERPKSDAELGKAQVEWKNKINYCVAAIKIWLEDKNFNETYPQIAKYRNSYNQPMIDIINKTYRCSNKILTDDEIKFLFKKIKADYNINQQAWIERIRAVAVALNPPPLADIKLL